MPQGIVRRVLAHNWRVPGCGLLFFMFLRMLKSAAGKAPGELRYRRKALSEHGCLPGGDEHEENKKGGFETLPYVLFEP